MAASKLKEVQKIAKQLREKNPKMKQSEAVKQAWKILKKKE